MDIGLFDKYKSIKLVPDGSLFGLDKRVIQSHGVCPACHHKLYYNRARTARFCKSKTCTNKFYIKL